MINCDLMILSAELDDQDRNLVHGSHTDRLNQRLTKPNLIRFKKGTCTVHEFHVSENELHMQTCDLVFQ